VFRNLRVHFNLGAGIDALMIFELVDDLVDRMTEYVALQVQAHHCQLLQPARQ
jgi:hypothetical protein